MPKTLEEQFGRIADALEALVAGGGLGGGEAAEEVAEEEAPDDKKGKGKPADKKAGDKKGGKAKGPTIDDVRNALREYAKLEGKDAAREKLKEVGDVDSISELDEEKYQDVIDACNA